MRSIFRFSSSAAAQDTASPDPDVSTRLSRLIERNRSAPPDLDTEASKKVRRVFLPDPDWIN
jgi:hypothetical protein